MPITKPTSKQKRDSKQRAAFEKSVNYSRPAQSQRPGFGGLVRVLNKRNEFLWVHEKFASEY